MWLRDVEMQLFEAVEDSELMAHAQDDTELFQMQQEPKESVAMGPRTRPPKLWFVHFIDF